MLPVGPDVSASASESSLRDVEEGVGLVFTALFMIIIIFMSMSMNNQICHYSYS